jgi:hypothetical protein
MTALSITAPVPSNTFAPMYAVVPSPGLAQAASASAIAGIDICDIFTRRSLR